MPHPLACGVLSDGEDAGGGVSLRIVTAGKRSELVCRRISTRWAGTELVEEEPRNHCVDIVIMELEMRPVEWLLLREQSKQGGLQMEVPAEVHAPMFLMLGPVAVVIVYQNVDRY